MHVYITATSGVGKTTVTDELRARGYTAYDTDNVPGLTRLEIKETGEPAEWPKGYVDWSYYSWNLQQEMLDEVLNSSESVFLSGLCGNQPDFYTRFGKLIVLTIDPEEHERRLRNRPAREAGDDEQNIQERLRKYPMLLQRFLDSGAILVDNSGSVERTVDEILRMCDVSPPVAQ